MTSGCVLAGRSCECNHVLVSFIELVVMPTRKDVERDGDMSAEETRQCGIEDLGLLYLIFFSRKSTISPAKNNNSKRCSGIPSPLSVTERYTPSG
jgi:hypothetical protein